MRKYEDLFVPCEPKKAWEWWMLTDTYCRCPIMRNCAGISCKDCIYAMENYSTRQQFYKDTFGDKQEETKMKKYEGLFVPCEPKKEWEWMLTDEGCRGKGINTENCARIACVNCIYSWRNSNLRQQLYKETFKDKKKETKMKKETEKGTVMELPNKEKAEFKFKQGDIVTVVNPNGTVSTYEIDSPMYDMVNRTCSYILTDGNELKEEHISHKLNCEKFSKYVIRGDNTEELKRLVLLCSDEV